MTEKIFVFGTGRSGTHSVVDILASREKTVALHEGRGTGPAGERVDLGNLMGVNVLLAGGRNRLRTYRESLVPEGFPRAVMERAFRSRSDFISRCTREGFHYCDVNRLGYNCINYIHSEHRSAKFVHVVRDGYRCVRSWYGRIGAYPARGDLFRFKAGQLRRRYLEGKRGGQGFADLAYDLYVAALLGSGSESASAAKTIASLSGRNQHLEKPRPLPGDPHYRAWRGYSRLQKLAWFWAWVNESIESRLEAVPEGQRLTLRIEDLGTAAGRLADFCGLRGGEFESKRVVRGKSREYAMEWDDRSRRQFNEIAGAGMKKYGYDLVGPSEDG